LSKYLFFLLAISLLLSQAVFADDLANQLANFGVGLDADITINNETLLASPQVILVDAEIRNPNDEPMSIYLIRQDSDGWKFVNLLGAIARTRKTP